METPELIGLKQRTRAFLLTRQVQRINFRYGAIHLTGHMLANVASRLNDWHRVPHPGDTSASRNGRPQQLKPGPTNHGNSIEFSKQNLGPGIAAQYITGSNKLIVPNEYIDSTLDGKATILHECVHAALDVAMRTNTPAYDEEAVALIAEFVWQRGVNNILVPHEPYGLVAYQLSERAFTRPGISFELADRRRMHNALMGIYPALGIPPSTEYDHDGVDASD
jgi:hypothetical protein